MQPLRYAILRHFDVAEPHFDLMFETLPGSALATWRSPVWPIEEVTALVRLKDHRRDYLEFEGTLTGNRGRVERIAGGNCEVSVGENAVWAVTLLDHPPTRLIFEQIQQEQWRGTRV